MHHDYSGCMTPQEQTTAESKDPHRSLSFHLYLSEDPSPQGLTEDHWGSPAASHPLREVKYLPVVVELRKAQFFFVCLAGLTELLLFLGACLAQLSDG